MESIAIINHSTTNSWHAKGQELLRISLKDHKPLLFSKGEQVIFSNAYEDKLYAIKQAGDLGFKKILWLDSSITLIEGKTLEPIEKYIADHGVYLYASGFKSGETANSKALEFYETNTDEQMRVPEVASNVVGIDLESEVGRYFFNAWVASLASEANQGVKWPSEDQAIKENPDPRFLFSRHDQSTASLAAWRAECKIDFESLFVFRQDETPQKETSIFRLKGL